MMEKPPDEMPPAALEDSNKSVGFLDLSAELRNHIYGLCLVASVGIHPVEIWVRSWDRNLEDEDENEDDDEENYSMGWGWRAQDLLSLSPNLLAVCKSVHREATPVLYGSNVFTLSPRSSFRAVPWIASIGDSVEHIRTLKIRRGANQKMVNDLLKSLKAASSLDKLVVCGSLWAHYRNSNTMATGLYPLILHLHRSRKDSEKKGALEVLQMGDIYDRQMSDAFAAEVKGILKKRLKC